MESITNQVNTLLKNCISLAYPKIKIDFTKFIVHRGTKTDYQFNQINALAKILNLSNNIVAETIHCELSKSKLVESVEIVYNGIQIFIILSVAKNHLQYMVNELYKYVVDNNFLPSPKIENLPKTILIDFSSPNIAKEMHVGHLRSTIIGESLCRIFEYCGSNVKRVNHIGDWGTQFGMLIAYIKQNNISEYNLSQLMIMYKESRKMFETDQIFKKNAHLETVGLQQGSDDNIAIWKKICAISMDSFNKIYVQLGTYSDVKGESFYQSRMVKLVEDLDNIINKNDGMKVLFAPGILLPFILVKSDGGFTYDTSDLTALRYRLFEEKADKVVYVVDSGQQQHLEILFKLAIDLGWAKQGQLDHVGFGLVLGSDGKKLKTRSGETIKLQSLLDQAFEHANTITTQLAKEKHPEWDQNMINLISNKIAINCIKYADLSNPRLSNYKFNLVKMINVKGNTAVYLMYALARCKAILRKVSNGPILLKSAFIDLKEIPEKNSLSESVLTDSKEVPERLLLSESVSTDSKEVPNIQIILNGEIILDNIDAKNLAFKVIKYSEVINDSIEQLAPHHLCNYLYDLVGSLTKFYEKNRCIQFGNDGKIIHINEHRIRLINLVMVIISKMFDLIGLEHIEQI
jgi:arginyl-tRNA synthetase